MSSITFGSQLGLLLHSAVRGGFWIRYGSFLIRYQCMCSSDFKSGIHAMYVMTNGGVFSLCVYSLKWWVLNQMEYQ